MKHIARVGKVWQDKRTGKTLNRELELAQNDSIDNYIMVKEGESKDTSFAMHNKKEDKKEMF